MVDTKKVKVTIIGGAGTVGSCTAFLLASQGLAREIIMVDNNHNLLMSQVIDISTSIVGLQDVVIRAGGDEDISESDVVIVTAGVPLAPGAPPGMGVQKGILNENLPLVREIAKKIGQYCPGAVVITVTNPVDPLNYAMYLSSGLDPHKCLGYSLNDSIRFRKAVALVTGAKSTQVDGIVMGAHHEPVAPLFSSIRIDGHHIPLSEDLRKRVREEERETIRSYVNLGTGRNAGWTTAVGLSAMIGAICTDSGKVFPCSAILTGEYGYANLSLGVPVILGREGIKQVMELPLLPDERTDLEYAAGVLGEAARAVQEAAT